MPRTNWFIVCWLVWLATTSSASDVVIDGRSFKIPEGFVLEKVAIPPLTDRPVVADFDELGRLYVADSSGSNENVKKQLVDQPHRIVRLEDSDGDGKFDKSVVFADKMMFPAGAMWLDGSLYVAAPPSIWKLTDTDGDGVADRREEWFAGKTLTGCANDLHGPYAGPDGRVYWTKGAFASQTYIRPGRDPFVTRAAHIFRAKTDGTDIEPVMTGGMDNPVEVAFTPEGERIFTTTFLQHPAGGKRDGLIHALYGGVYGKDHDVLDGHPRTGPDLLAPLVHLGPAAPSGLIRAESDTLGSRDCLFTACFNLRKITRHRLKPAGASFTVETDDFVSSDDLDFHPTDVLEDADGSLLIIDTGGWYKICCPTSQLVKPDVLGGIYRIKPVGGSTLADPRGRTLDWSTARIGDLAARLDDPRFAVRNRAVAMLAKQGDTSLGEIQRILQSDRSVVARRMAVWTACRIDSLAARSLGRIGLEDADTSVRQAAIQAAGLWRDPLARTRLAEILRTGSIPERRGAAEALGRLEPGPAEIDALLQASASPDPALRHSTTFALIESHDSQGTRAGLNSPSPLVQRTALIALDQMPGGNLDPDPVTRSLFATDLDLKASAWWIAAHHPELAESLVVSFRSHLSAKPDQNASNSKELADRIGPLCRYPAVQRFLGEVIEAPRSDRRVWLRVMAQSGLKELPQSWIPALDQAFRDSDPRVVAGALAVVKSLPLHGDSGRELQHSLLKIARDPARSVGERLPALSAVSGPHLPVDPDLLVFLIDCLRPDRPTAERTGAADILAKSDLSSSQRRNLLESVSTAGPIELARLLDVFDRESNPEIGRKLVEALHKSRSRSSLRVESLRPKLDKFGDSIKGDAEELYRSIEADSAERHNQLEAILANGKSGDIRRGQAVFNSPKASCVACHAIGYVGGKLGPDLTKIGQIRSDRDLLESIVYPSAGFVRSYEPVAVATKDGMVISGLLRKDTADELVIAVAADREVRVARDQVEEMQPGTVSVMPAGFEKQLSLQELTDLIAFLKACR